MNNRFLFLFSCLLAAANFATASDWAHWLGPSRDKIAEKDAQFDSDLENWEIAWQKEVGLGYSSITTADGRAYTMGHDGGSLETIYCFDLTTGDMIWQYSYEAQLMPRLHVGGPNASVTISEGVAYAVSKDGQAFGLDAATGGVIWEQDLKDLMGIELPKWGFASSPLLYGDQILLSSGRVAAIDRSNGVLNWASENVYEPGYGTPMVFSSKGKEYIAAFDSEGLSIVTATNGKEVARHSVRPKYNLTAATPTIRQNGKRIFLSTNVGTEMLRFDGASLDVDWSDRDIQNYTSGQVLIDGVVYGVDGNYKTMKSKLYAMDFETGEIHWSKSDYGYASLIAVGDILLILTEQGDLVTAKASKGSYQEISRRSLLDALCWTDPTYSNGRIYIRNDQGTVISLKPR